jgi:hypothetical protein
VFECHVIGALGARCEPDLSPYGTGDLGLDTSILVGIVFLLATAAILIWRWMHTRRSAGLVTLSREERGDISQRLRQDPRFKVLKGRDGPSPLTARTIFSLSGSA